MFAVWPGVADVAPPTAVAALVSVTISCVCAALVDSVPVKRR
jgi:hypothetical protein